jgi:hypothetical protein
MMQDGMPSDLDLHFSRPVNTIEIVQPVLSGNYLCRLPRFSSAISLSIVHMISVSSAFLKSAGLLKKLRWNYYSRHPIDLEKRQEEFRRLIGRSLEQGRFRALGKRKNVFATSDPGFSS